MKKPNITVGAWKDTISKSVKILEGMLYCEAVDVYLLLSHCVMHSRKWFGDVLERIKSILSANYMDPNGINVGAKRVNIGYL